ncbi:MAG TPA: dienelactone hydrolase family protein [Pyrinomonadaceae bacterium]|nr:dienelactone hydrolase family protein [Pyrinomonadaceae bacterium]
MCIPEDCNNDETPNNGIERRTFLTGVTAAVVGVALASERRAQQQQPPPTNALNDPNVIQGMVSFKSGADIIQGYLARPRKAGRFRAVVVLHGSLHLPEDHRYTAAQLAQGDFVSLAIRRFSRTPDLTQAELNRSDREDRRYLSNTFVEQELQDAQAAINYLKSLSYVKRKGVGLVGFCGGGCQSVLLSTQSKDISAVVAFYAPPVLLEQFQAPNDRRPDLMDVVGQINVPLQGHYGTADVAVPIADVRKFEEALRKQKKTVEFFYYEGANHAFCDYTRPRAYRPEAAALAKSRMLEFLKRNLR